MEDVPLTTYETTPGIPRCLLQKHFVVDQNDLASGGPQFLFLLLIAKRFMIPKFSWESVRSFCSERTYKECQDSPITMLSTEYVKNIKP